MGARDLRLRYVQQVSNRSGSSLSDGWSIVQLHDEEPIVGETESLLDWRRAEKRFKEEVKAEKATSKGGQGVVSRWFRCFSLLSAAHKKCLVGHR